MSKKDDYWTHRERMYKTLKIMREILGWECFTSWDDYRRKYGMNEYNLGAGISFTTPTPVAYWNSIRHMWLVFSTDHEELDEFDPASKRDDALKVIEAMSKDIEAQPHCVAFIKAMSQHLTPEQICDAVLEAIEPAKEESK